MGKFRCMSINVGCGHNSSSSAFSKKSFYFLSVRTSGPFSCFSQVWRYSYVAPVIRLRLLAEGSQRSSYDLSHRCHFVNFALNVKREDRLRASDRCCGSILLVHLIPRAGLESHSCSSCSRDILLLHSMCIRTAYFNLTQ